MATTIGDGFTAFTAGLGIVTADAFSAGAASMPTPEGDRDWGGWLWFHSGGALISRSVTEVDEGFPLGALRIPIDTKAMRKMSPNETIFGAVSFTTEIGTATVSFVGRTRMLFLLS